MMNFGILGNSPKSVGAEGRELNQRQIQYQDYQDSSCGEEEQAKDLHNSGVKFFKLATTR